MILSFMMFSPNLELIKVQWGIRGNYLIVLYCSALYIIQQMLFLYVVKLSQFPQYLTQDLDFREVFHFIISST